MSNLPQAVLDQVRARLGTTLKDKWRIDAVLGVGGMAAVYAATHRTGSRVAIKMLHPQLSLNESVRKRFAQEGYVANTVEHDGVARVLDDDVADDGAAFLVMELLEGETSAARAERLGGKLPVGEVAFLGESVASVLAAAHAKGIIHRDIKPDNVFVTDAGRVVVLDFGIARIKDATGISASQTRTGTMMGTPAFMPPEQARGRANEMDATSDVWALGATLFYLASGRPVHEAETPNEQLVAAATLPAPSLSRVAPDVPAPLAEVVDRALEFAKENRFPDARAFETALRDALLAISWGPGAQPGLGPTTERPPPLGANESADGHSGRGPTIGPVEVAPASSRTTRFVRAAIVGAALGVAVLGAAAIVGRRVAPRAPAAVPPASTEEAPPPAQSTAQAPSSTPPASAEPVTSSEPAPVATPSPSSSSSFGAVAHPRTPHSRPSWLDRRK
ncbi:MAG TPA: protein kinase [Polyangiaceae bacterium]|jgi:serine/threonine-protein kinase